MLHLFEITIIQGICRAKQSEVSDYLYDMFTVSSLRSSRLYIKLTFY